MNTADHVAPITEVIKQANLQSVNVAGSDWLHVPNANLEFDPIASRIWRAPTRSQAVLDHDL